MAFVYILKDKAVYNIVAALFLLPKNDKMVTRIWYQNFQIVTFRKV